MLGFIHQFMKYLFSCTPQTVPVLAGVGVVAVTAILAKIFLPGLFGGKKKGAPTTLKDATVKYPLKLIDKEVRS